MWFAGFILEMTWFFVCLTFGIGFMVFGVRITWSFMNNISKTIDKKIGGMDSTKFDLYEIYRRRRK